MTSTKAFMDKDSSPEDSRCFSLEVQREERACNDETAGVHRQLTSNHSNAPQLVSTSSELDLTGVKLVSTLLFAQEVGKETGGVHRQLTSNHSHAPQFVSTPQKLVSAPQFSQKVQKECPRNEATGGVHRQPTFDPSNVPQLDVLTLLEPVSSDASEEVSSSKLPETEEKIDVIYQHTLEKINEKKGGSKLDIEDLGILKRGSGGSVINKCRYKEKIGKSGYKYMAAKRMNISSFPDFKTEIEHAANHSNHENIAGYERHVLLIRKDYKEVNEAVVKQCPDPKEILRAAVKGIKHLHGHNILHMDIKPSNFMFKEDSIKAGKFRYVLKIIDFGLSKKIDPDRSCASTCDVVGTRSYMSPEHHNQTSFKPTKATDMFSLGLLFYYVLTKGKHPFGAKENAIAFHIEEYMEQPSLKGLVLDNKEDEVLARDLVLRMIQKLPEDRPTIEEVEIHPYFWNAEKKDSFYRAANAIIMVYDKSNVKSDGGRFLASLNELRENMKRDNLKLAHIPKYQGKPNKQTGELREMDYKNVQTYVRFVRNTLEHWNDCFAHLKKEEKDKLPKKIEDRLRMLTSAYPDILRDLYYKLVTDANFQDKFGELAKIDLTKVKSKIQDPKKDGAV
uniref:serine/threonine-protein kinase/endoribonuclease IRE2-like isoform X2 n=1 Tax=Ciona intestinalis TaxID=7719 RepID=UPI000EF557EE|nr:serine/threonine-protein kinase/endoribonuclease IRE2-like isoform X2 [Ciona intestinalis]|eukprot:XP_026695114.1 serine/threonine-protein kinase/endoribonuclease IRE2-like isoform X2 [Ciona intestinalis]